MNFSHNELRILWEAISQYCDNSVEPKDIAVEEKPDGHETQKLVEEYETAVGIRSKLDQYFSVEKMSSRKI